MPNMFYSLNYDNDYKGYVVTLTKVWESGQLQMKPLRKFRDQGDALAFRDFDCPHLMEIQINMLVKGYRPDVFFKRINGNRFLKLEIKQLTLF